MGSTLSRESYFRSIKSIRMYQELYEYLILNKQLNVPGFGTFLLERKPAGTDVVHRQISPPVYTISLLQNQGSPTKKFFYWLAERLKIHYHEAIVRFNGFTYELKNQVLTGQTITWDHVGTLSRTISGEIRFDSSLTGYNFDPPVSAARIIREKAIHTVRAIAALRMNSRIIEENAVASGFELLANNEFFVGAPVGIVHAGGLVITAIPRNQNLSRFVLLPPIRGR